MESGLGVRLLLDTHVWLWSLIQPERVDRSARRAMQQGTEVYLSPVSIWELNHLVKRGRIRVKQSLNELLDRGIRESSIREAPITVAVALEAARIQLPQPDPGDVFIAATAIVHDLTLVTSDEQLLACSWLKTISAG